jgi:tRNA(Ser,Leu) C12 N-acetylase TAN1
MAKLIVTSRGFEEVRQMIAAVRRALPEAHIRRTGFRGVVELEAKGRSLELACKLAQECPLDIGRVVAVLAEVQSTFEAIKETAVKIGAEHIREDEKFCFRLHKRGAHWLELETPKLEYEIGGAIWVALKQKFGREPRVDLKNPDVTVVAEVLGPNTAVGILRKR